MLSFCVALKNRSRVLVEGRELRLFTNCVKIIVDSVGGGIAAELVVADWKSDDWPLKRLRMQTVCFIALLQSDRLVVFNLHELAG